MKLKNINSIKPLHTYIDILENRNLILKQVKGKKGIYIWINMISNKSYVGSSIDLSRRLREYFNINHLKIELNKKNSHIYRALIKHNYINFKLIIAEYCSMENLIEREQYYLNNYNLEYNILKTAGCLKGFEHNNLTKEKLRNLRLGKITSEATKLKLILSSNASPIQVKNNITNEILIFPSISRAGNFIGIHPSSIRESFKKKNYYKNKFFFLTKNI